MTSQLPNLSVGGANTPPAAEPSSNAIRWLLGIRLVVISLVVFSVIAGIHIWLGYNPFGV